MVTHANNTEYVTGWRSEPNTRGTWSLLYSCVFTLFLCVYSAIHINIPARGEPGNAHFWRKVKWVVIAIFAPEVVLYSAWQQYYIASSFCRDLYNIKLEQAGIQPLSDRTLSQRLWEFIYTFGRWGKKPSRKTNSTIGGAIASMSQPPPTPNPFSLRYGFYVVMGGLVVDVSEIYDNVSRLTLTPDGVLKFAKKTHWESFFVPDETIKDKSKADNLAKILIFFQVAWTLLQCVSRAALGYPLTVLEVHTLVHAACAMLMYGLWFRKPLNVGDPSLVVIGSPEETALEMIRSPGSAYQPFTTLKPQTQFAEVYYGAPNEVIHIARNQSGEEGSEASFLVFDVTRMPSAYERESNTLVCSVLQTSTSQNHTSHNDQVADESTIQPKVNHVNTSTLESQPVTSSDEELASFSRLQFHDVDRALLLVTGQTLTSGVGPSVWFTSDPWEDGFGWHELVARTMRLKRLSPKAIQIHEVNPELKDVLLGPDTEQYTLRVLWHKLAVHLSHKDLLRWHRAGAAFAHELEAGEAKSLNPNNESVTSVSGAVANSNGPGPIDPIENGPAADGKTSRLEPRLRSLLGNDLLLRPFRILSRSFTIRSPNMDFQVADELLTLSGDDATGTGLTAICSFLLVSGVYAGIHLALWKHDFPSETERLLWRIAGCALAGPLAIFLAGLLVVLPWDWLEGRTDYRERALEQALKENNRRLPSSRERPSFIWSLVAPLAHFFWVALEDAVAFLILLIFAGGFTLYVLARLYIVVESFVSLRRVPVSVYETVTWAQYIPHF